MYRFRELPSRPDGWDDLIRSFDTKTLFHESAWHAHLGDIEPAGRMQYYEITRAERRVGYHCAFQVRKFGIPIHGSPLGGTGTNFMGPVVNEHEDQGGLMQALWNLAGVRRFLHAELSNPWLMKSVMESQGFRVHPAVTRLIPIEADEDRAWSALTSNARNRIKKADRNGLSVERTDDESMTDQYFAQFKEVYGRQGLRVPFGPERPRSLFRNLHARGRLLAIDVRSDSETIATGLFPYDERCIYFWGGASWQAHLDLCPNEAMHWEVIRFAVEKGIKWYNMCGGRSRFKAKFGGEDVPYLHYSRSALPGLQLARRAYRRLHFWRLRTR